MIVILEEKRSAAAHVYMRWCVGAMLATRAPCVMNNEHKKIAKDFAKIMASTPVILGLQII